MDSVGKSKRSKLGDSTVPENCINQETTSERVKPLNIGIYTGRLRNNSERSERLVRQHSTKASKQLFFSNPNPLTPIKQRTLSPALNAESPKDIRSYMFMKGTHIKEVCVNSNPNTPRVTTKDNTTWHRAQPHQSMKCLFSNLLNNKLHPYNKHQKPTLPDNSLTPAVETIQVIQVCSTPMV